MSLPPSQSPPPTPPSPISHSSQRGRFVGRVVANLPLCTDHKKVVLELRDFPPSQAGQFVQIDCGGEEITAAIPPNAGMTPGEERETKVVEWELGTRPKLGVGSEKGMGEDADFREPRAFLRRPFSLGGRRERADGMTEIDIIYRMVGKGTMFLGQLQPGDAVSLLGPLGRGFHCPEDVGLAVLVGGGVGVPPILYLAEDLREGEKDAAKREVVAFVGALRKDLLALQLVPGVAISREGEPGMGVVELARLSIPTAITTDDGSVGMKGLVTVALRRYLEQVGHAVPIGAGGAKGIMVFCCGPTPMMRAVAGVCAELGVRCQVSLEQPMACGMGTCQSCVVKIREGAGSAGENGWVYKLTCKDGPVFLASDVVW